MYIVCPDNHSKTKHYLWSIMIIRLWNKLSPIASWSWATRQLHSDLNHCQYNKQKWKQTMPACETFTSWLEKPGIVIIASPKALDHIHFMHGFQKIGTGLLCCHSMINNENIGIAKVNMKWYPALNSNCKQKSCTVWERWCNNCHWHWYILMM